MNARRWVVVCLALTLSGFCACSSKSGDDDAADDAQAGAAAMGSGGSGGASPSQAASGSGGSASVPVGTGGKGSSGAGGNTGSGGAGGAGGPGGSGAGGSSADAGMPPSGDTGTLPAITDPSKPGHFTLKEVENVGPGMNYTTIAPVELGEGGIKHPILIWGPGAGSWPAIYQTMLDHIASHGFVIVSYNSTPQGPELLTAIDWIVEENEREGSDFFGKLDTTKIAMGGQSAGSLGTFAVADDMRLTTTLHINGGTFDPHTDVMNLKKPALFICGDDPAVTGGDGTEVSDLARPNCDIDFENAMAPVWYGVVIGSSHTTVIDNPLSDANAAANPLMKHYLAATAAWLRWQLADDQVMKALFVGPSCGFCTQMSTWQVEQKDLD